MRTIDQGTSWRSQEHVNLHKDQTANALPGLGFGVCRQWASFSYVSPIVVRCAWIHNFGEEQPSPMTT
eukprot:437227-Amphidinium_carterae.1